ncbi:MAG: hypothetical protein PF545_05700 [Elusimicrobia bacterium]|jgi:phosphopantothenoylcysteine decarboxylase/phosphopantothenate--cysteine ligase|nr:hypothetical protein [Elusimicrobiota bacterium]
MNVLLGVTGSVAAYKSAVIASSLVKKGHRVKTVMTDAATEFIAPLTFKSLTGQRVYKDSFSPDYDKDHTALSVWADIIIVAPLTANTAAKITAGIADNLLLSVILDFTGPVFMAPAMHENMWNNAATVKNFTVLRERGVHIYNPEKGALAGLKTGVGRMISPEDIIIKTTDILKKDYPELLNAKKR